MSTQNWCKNTICKSFSWCHNTSMRYKKHFKNWQSIKTKILKLSMAFGILILEHGKDKTFLIQYNLFAVAWNFSRIYGKLNSY